MTRGYIRRRKIKGGFVWAVSIVVADPQTGAMKEQERGRYKTKREASAALVKLQGEGEAGTLVGRDKRTVSEVLEFWMQTEVLPNRRGTTIDRYRSVIRVHLLPGLGGVQVQNLKPAQVDQFYARKRAEGTGAATLVFCHVVLTLALKMSLRYGWVARNVMTAVRRPHLEPRPKQVWSQEQLARFIVEAESSGYGPIWLLASLTGMRRGELLGVRWRDVDLEKGTLYIVQTQVARDHGMETSDPKTMKGRRMLHLRPIMVESLRRHRVRQNEMRLKAGPAWQDNDLVFSTEMGTPIHARSLWNRYKATVERAGVPHIGIHGLRHTVATMAIASGEDVRTVSDLLGHSRTSITTDIYAHVLPHRKLELASNIERLVLGNGGQAASGQ